jgi:hypothetical protein
MRFRKTLTGYVVAVVLVWLAIFAIGYVTHGPTPGYPLLHVFGGFMIGMLAMYIATRVYRQN